LHLEIERLAMICPGQDRHQRLTSLQVALLGPGDGMGGVYRRTDGLSFGFALAETFSIGLS
jgi:hypothetical protein